MALTGRKAVFQQPYAEFGSLPPSRRILGFLALDRLSVGDVKLTAGIWRGNTIPLHRALPIALALLAAGVAEAQAQAAPTGEVPPCIQKFLPLREEVQKRHTTTQNAINRKVPPAELCRLFTQFSEAETKMIKYVEDQGMRCGFPPEALPSMKAGHVKALEYRKQACDAAAAREGDNGPGARRE